MSFVRYNSQYSGSGTGSVYYNTSTSWKLTLNFTPTPGHTLVVYMNMGFPNPGTVSMTYGSVTMNQVDYNYQNTNTFATTIVFECIVPQSTGNTLTFTSQFACNLITTIVEEVSGIMGVDQLSNTEQTASNTYSTAVNTTLYPNEYAVNLFFYNAAVPTYSNPTNGYTLLNATPTHITDVGWTWVSGSPSTSSGVTQGMILAYKNTSGIGTIGGSITDAGSNNIISKNSVISFVTPSINSSLTRINQQYSGSGNGTTSYNVSAGWTLNLSFTPTSGNVLFLYMNFAFPNPGVETVTFGTVTMTQLVNNYNNTNTYHTTCVFSCVVPPNPDTKLVLNTTVSCNLITSILEEVSGVLNCSIYDQLTITEQTASNTYSTQTTSSTLNNAEYAINFFTYNGTAGNDPILSNPTNGFTLFRASDVKISDTGWSWTIGQPTLNASSYAIGQMCAYKILSSTQTTGGSVTDSGGFNNLSKNTTITFAIASLPPAINTSFINPTPIIFAQAYAAGIIQR
jgi:hypothetical protein